MITFKLLTGRVDKYCNFCIRILDDIHAVDIYRIDNPNKVSGGLVIQICEFCARELHDQMKDMDA